MSFARRDFTESLVRVDIDPSQIERVLWAWGVGHEDGDESGYGSWGGGFLMRLRDGRYAYLSGWCDYTGWGCQDGADVQYVDHEPSLAELRAIPRDDEFDDDEGPWLPHPDTAIEPEPVDLNRWLAAGAPSEEIRG